MVININSISKKCNIIVENCAVSLVLGTSKKKKQLVVSDTRLQLAESNFALNIIYCTDVLSSVLIRDTLIR